MSISPNGKGPGRSRLAPVPAGRWLNRHFAVDLALVAATAATVCFFIPVYHVGVSPAEFGFLDRSLFFKLCAGLGGVTFVPLFLAVAGLHGMGFRRAARAFAVFVLVWAVLAGIAFPLVRSNGMIEASETQLDRGHLVVVAALAGGCAGLARFRRGTAASALFGLVLLATTALPALPAFFAAFAKPAPPVDFFRVSVERNVFVLSFDGIPGTVARTVLEQDPELAAAFRDFVFFTNAVGQAPATRASLRSELFGNRDYHALGATDDEVDAALGLDSLWMNRVDNSYTYGSYNAYNARADRRVAPLSFLPAPEGQAVDQHLFWLELLLARTGSPLLPRWWKKARLGETVRNWAAPAAGRAEGLRLRSKRYAGPRWKQDYVLQKIDYEWIVGHWVAETNGLAARHMHFLHVHFPVDFDENGTFRGDDRKWHRANQNFRGLCNQCRASFQQFAAFLRRLRELSIYDRSLIVLKSDHGEPAPYYDFFPNDVRINGNEKWGLDRYLPLLMIKDFGRKSDRLVRDPRRATLPDLAKTLCRAAHVDGVDCARFPGLDLLTPGAQPDTPYFYLETVKNGDSTFRFDTHRTLRLERSDRALQDVLADSGAVELDSPSRGPRR